MQAPWILAVFLARHLTLTVPLSIQVYSVIGYWQNLLHPTQGEGA